MGDNKPDFTGIVALLGLVGLCVHMCVCTSLLRKWILGPPLCQNVHLFVYLCMCVFLVCECAGDCLCVPAVCVHVCAHACMPHSIFLWSLGYLCAGQPRVEGADGEVAGSGQLRVRTPSRE